MEDLNISFDENLYLPLAKEAAVYALVLIYLMILRRYEDIIKKFQTLAEMCLFELRIEFRCHSMYFMDLALREVSKI